MPNTVCVPLRNRAGEWLDYAMLDECDIALSAKRWFRSPCGYAFRNIWTGSGYSRIMMHRAVLGLASDDPRVCDHISGDRLDNRRKNLRIVDRFENTQNLVCININNTSGVPGVHWRSRERKWGAMIRRNRVRHDLGFFANKDDAIAAILAKRAELGLPCRWRPSASIALGKSAR